MKVYQVGEHRFSDASVRDQKKFKTPADRFKAWVEQVCTSVTPGPGGSKRIDEIDVGRLAPHSGTESYALSLHIFANRAPWGSCARPSATSELEYSIGLTVIAESKWHRKQGAEAATVPVAAATATAAPVQNSEETEVEAGNDDAQM